MSSHQNFIDKLVTTIGLLIVFCAKTSRRCNDRKENVPIIPIIIVYFIVIVFNIIYIINKTYNN